VEKNTEGQVCGLSTAQAQRRMSDKWSMGWIDRSDLFDANGQTQHNDEL
jgi:hypothetical protein